MFNGIVTWIVRPDSSRTLARKHYLLAQEHYQAELYATGEERKSATEERILKTYELWKPVFNNLRVSGSCAIAEQTQTWLRTPKNLDIVLVRNRTVLSFMVNVGERNNSFLVERRSFKMNPWGEIKYQAYFPTTVDEAIANRERNPNLEFVYVDPDTNKIIAESQVRIYLVDQETPGTLTSREFRAGEFMVPKETFTGMPIAIGKEAIPCVSLEYLLALKEFVVEREKRKDPKHREDSERIRTAIAQHLLKRQAHARN